MEDRENAVNFEIAAMKSGTTIYIYIFIVQVRQGGGVMYVT